MITDSIKNINKYLGISHNLDAAIEVISKLDMDTIPFGKVSMDDGKVTYRCGMEKTRSELGVKFEAHRKYIDIHICVTGQERIRLANIYSLRQIEEYDEKSDMAWFEGNGEWDVTIHAGEFLICFEEDAHMPLLDHGERAEFKKIMVKVLVC